MKTEPGHRLLVAGGDFFPQGTATEERLKGIAALEAMKAMKYDAVSFGDLDFAFGTEVLVTEMKGLNVVNTNIVWAADSKPVGVPMIVKTYKGMQASAKPAKTLRVAVLAFMDERLQSSLDFFLENDRRKVKILPAVATAKDWVKRARKQADVVVVLLHQQSAEAVKFVDQVPGIDVIVSGHTVEELIGAPRHQGETWIVGNGDRARYVGELRFLLTDTGKLSEPEPRQVPLNAEWGEDSIVADIVKSFKTSLEAERGLPSARSSTSSEVPPSWAGVEVCAACHRPTVESWKKTGHGHAYATLQAKHDHVREECLKCHVLGLGTPGGFDVTAPQEGLANVQCENCHGSGVKHVVAADADKKKTIVGHPSAAVCAGCHNIERDPNFKFDVSWPKIKH